MSQPTPYARQFDFTGWSTSRPNTPHPGVQIDAELNAIRSALNHLLTNIALIQRDDTALANGTVGIDQLNSVVQAMLAAGGFTVRGAWAASTAYVRGDVVANDELLYLVIEDHNSSASLAADIASGYVTSAIFDPHALIEFQTELADTGGAALVGTTTAAATVQTLLDSIRAALGITGAAEHFSTFTGSLFSDNQTAKQLFQATETALEARPTSATLADTGGAALIGTANFTGDTIPDGSNSQEALQALETAHERYANIISRRYIDVADYAPSDDSLDAFSAIQEAFDDGYGREIVFTNPIGGTRYYRSLTRVNGGLIMPIKARIIFEDAAILDFSDYATSGTSLAYMKATGTVASADNLASNATIGDSTITLGTGAGAAYSRGDYAYLNSDADFTTEDGTLGKQGEWVQIVSIAGDVLTIAGMLRDSYATADTAKLTRFTDPASVSIENINLVGCGKFSAAAEGDRGIEIINGVDCRLLGGSVAWSDKYGTIFTNILNGKIDGVDFVKDENSASNPVAYGVALASACENLEVANCDAVHGREGFALTVSGSLPGVMRDVVFRKNRARGMWRSGYTSHDTHLNWRCEGNLAEDCEQGFDCRIIDATFIKNKIRRMGAFSGTLDCGFQLGSGAGQVRFEGNDYEDVLRGIYMPSSILHEVVPGDITAKGEIMRGVRAYGVLLDYRLSPGSGTNPSDPLGTVTVTECDIDAVTSGTAPRGIELHGRWTKPVVARNTFRGGNANRVVYLHATSNSGTVGSIDPVVVDNEYESTFTAPLVQHASGITKLSSNRGIGHWASGEILRGSKTHDFGSLAGAYGAFESTTVTVTGAAVGDKATAWMELAGTTGIWYKAQVTAADTVTVHAINFTSSAGDPASGTLHVEVVKE